MFDLISVYKYVAAPVCITDLFLIPVCVLISAPVSVSSTVTSSDLQNIEKIFRLVANSSGPAKNEWFDQPRYTHGGEVVAIAFII